MRYRLQGPRRQAKITAALTRGSAKDKCARNSCPALCSCDLSEMHSGSLSLARLLQSQTKIKTKIEY